MPPHHLAGRAGSIQLPVLPQFRFVSFGPRYPSGRIPQCDASAAPEVVLLVLSAQRYLHPGWGSTRTSAGRPHEMQGVTGKSCLFSSELPYTSSDVPGSMDHGQLELVVTALRYAEADAPERRAFTRTAFGSGGASSSRASAGSWSSGSVRRKAFSTTSDSRRHVLKS